MDNSQLIKQNGQGYNKIYPLTYIQGVIDSVSGKELDEILTRINHIYVPYQDNLANTRLAVPHFFKNFGTYLSYKEGAKLKTEYYKGTDTSDAEWVKDENWELVPDLAYIEDLNSRIPDASILPSQLSPALWEIIGEHHDIVNLPDDEDLEQHCFVLRFKDRKYRPLVASGKGAKILRRNWINNINVLTQEMVNEENTIYEVRYDFDLQGATINLHTNSSLKFVGGTINNGTVTVSNGDLIGIRSFNEAGTATFEGTFVKGLILTFDDGVKYFNGTEWVGIATGGEIETITGAEVTSVTESSTAQATAKIVDNVVQFTFGLPKGEKGDKGDVGPQGPEGPMGPGGGEKGDPGDPGLSYVTINCYKASDSEPATPVGGSYNFDEHIMSYPSGWNDRVSEVEGVIWMSSNTFCSDGTNSGWTAPFRISGPAGTDGEDGSNYEYIYTRTTNVDTVPDHPETAQEDDYIPSGWFDHPQGISETYKVEWVCVRIKKENTWGAFTAPTIWSRWGENGKDGDGVEYIFTLTTGNTHPATPTTSENVDEYIPPQGSNENPWTDEPSGISDTYHYEWVSQRKMKDGVWQAFSTPVVWAYKAQDGVIPNWKTYIYKQSPTKPDKPVSTDLVPEGWKDYPDSPEGQWWQCVGLVNGVDNLVESWSEVIPVNGRDGAGGARVEFRFAVNDSHSVAPDLDRDERNPSGWTTSFPSKNDSQYMWMTSAEINANDSLVNQWNLPVCISGEQGPKGETGPAGTPGGQGPAGIDGLPGVGLEARYCIGDETTYNGDDQPSGADPTGWQRTIPSTTDDKPYIWCIQGKITYTSAEDSGEYTWSRPFRLSGTNGLDGADGAQGRNGQIVYPAGIYSRTTTYTTTDTAAPYVLDTTDGNYYVMNYVGSWTGTEQPSNADTPSESFAQSGGQYWTKCDRFEAVFAKIGIISNGMIGSAVYNGNYMFSQQGINPSSSNASTTEYQEFDEDHIYDGTFTPNILFDFSNGTGHLAAGKIKFMEDGQVELPPTGYLTAVNQYSALEYTQTQVNYAITNGTTNEAKITIRQANTESSLDKPSTGQTPVLMEKTVNLPYGGAVMATNNRHWYGIYKDDELILKAEATGTPPNVGTVGVTKDSSLPSIEFTRVIAETTEEGNYEVMGTNPPAVRYGGSICTITVTARNTSTSSTTMRANYDSTYISSVRLNGTTMQPGGVDNNPITVNANGVVTIMITCKVPSTSFTTSVTLKS